MSKYWDGKRRYEDGSKAYTYLKLWCHMPEMCPRLAKIRRKMWVAQSYKEKEYDFINNRWR